MVDTSKLTEDERLSQNWATAGAEPHLVRLPELRHLVLDHLDPRRLLHHVRRGVEQRRPHRHLVGWLILSDLHPHHRLLHVRAGVGVPDLGRHLLVGEQAGRPARRASTPAGSTSSVCSVIIASVVYGAATFLNITIGCSASYVTDFLGGDYLHQQFFWFIVLMVR